MSSAAPAAPPSPSPRDFDSFNRQAAMLKSPGFKNSIWFPLSIFGSFIGGVGGIFFLTRKQDKAFQVKLFQARVGAQFLAVSSVLGMILYFGTKDDKKKLEK